MSESIVFDVGASRKKKDDLSSGLLDKSLGRFLLSFCCFLINNSLSNDYSRREAI